MSSVFRRINLSRDAVELLPAGPMRRQARTLNEEVNPKAEYGVVVGLASEMLLGGAPQLPDWVDAETRYLIVSDVPEPATLRLPAVFGLRKPHVRLHTSRSTDVVKRFVLAQARDDVWEGILDAYVLGGALIAILGDMTIREFPIGRLPKVRHLPAGGRSQFEVDEFGSFLHWPASDVHLGASQLLQAVDPMFLTDVEIRRYAMEKVSLALLDMRRERGLKQSEILGLSERHVRRLENEEGVRLTVEAAERYAASFGLDLDAFLGELSRRLTSLADSGAPGRDVQRVNAG